MNLGNVVQGHVLDVNKKHLEKALQDYDSQLYIKWNAKKFNGHGCWEVRRRPNQKKLIKRAEGFYELAYVENDMIHHVLDAQFLSYHILARLREMDVWGIKDFDKHLHDLQDASARITKEKAEDELRYNLKSNRRILQQYKDAVASGYNPFQFFAGTYEDID